MSRFWIAFLAVPLVAAAAAKLSAPQKLTASVSFVPGPVNGVLIQRDGETLAIYGDPRPNPASVRMVLFTHHRRDVVWAGLPVIEHGAEAVAPETERALFAAPGQFWVNYRTARFHDYSNQSSRILADPVRLSRTVRGGDTIDWHGLAIHALATPGCTRGAVSYLFAVDGKRIACTGDLIYGDGQLLDLYSLQDAVPEAKEDGYHGYAARAGDVVESLRKIAESKPDILIPARGPVIRDPRGAIDTLVRRLQAVFASHFAIDALRWYRGDEKIRIMAGRVLAATPVQRMPMAETVQNKLPDWIVPITNSRLLVSRTGAAFLIDCGNREVVQEVERMKQGGRIRGLDAIYITHYHDDHTDQAQTMASEFHCPVYFCREMRDILEHPGAYHMPCLTTHQIVSGHPMDDGAKVRWNEFELTYSYFPGQTLYHGGLTVTKDNGETILFAGDSFTPTGMDDYCLLNRNFMGPEPGFLNCLRALRRMAGSYLVINQHVPPAFRFSPAQLDFMIANFEKRRELMSALFPWDDPNYGLDAEWARFYPYGSEAAQRETLRLKFIVRNHSPERREFRITPHVPAGWKAPGPLRLSVAPRQEQAVDIPVTTGGPGLRIVTADVAFGPWDLRQWSEAMVEVK